MRILEPGDRASLADLVEREQEAGRAVVLVGSGVDRHSVLAAFAEALGVRRARGIRNLDALADTLRELDAPEGTTLVWEATRVHDTDPRTYAAVAGLLADLEAECPDLRIVVDLR